MDVDLRPSESDRRAGANRERRRENARRYRERHKDRIREKERRYREANKERIHENARRYREANKERIAEYHREYAIEHREKQRINSNRWRLYHGYGMSLGDWEWLLADQRGRCACCGKQFLLGERIEVDHDHALGGAAYNPDKARLRRSVRGLVHGGCNSVVGRVELGTYPGRNTRRYTPDWPERKRRAESYIAKGRYPFTERE